MSEYTGRKIAIIADIHGLLQPLKAAIAECKKDLYTVRRLGFGFVQDMKKNSKLSYDDKVVNGHYILTCVIGFDNMINILKTKKS